MDVSSALRIVELDQSGRDRIPVGPGIWETSGIIDAAKLVRAGQLALRRAGSRADRRPRPNTVEDGQLLILVGPDARNKKDDD